MLEWCSLRFVDNAPPAAWILTGIIAFLILAVLECRDWLNFKKWWYFRVSLITLFAMWVAGVAISYAMFGIAQTPVAQTLGVGSVPSVQQPPNAPQQPQNTVAPPPVQPPAPVILKGGPIGPLTTLDMRAGLGAKPGGAAMGGKPPAPIDFRWAVVMTYPQSNYEFSEIIYRLMVDAHLLVRRLDPPPDHNKVLNAPYLAPSQRQGVTLHGDDLLSKALYGAFSTCMKAAITDKTVDGLQEWYVKNGQVAPEQHVIWIEIGEGSPWTMEPQCWK